MRLKDFAPLALAAAISGCGEKAADDKAGLSKIGQNQKPDIVYVAPACEGKNRTDPSKVVDLPERKVLGIGGKIEVMPAYGAFYIDLLDTPTGSPTLDIFLPANEKTTYEAFGRTNLTGNPELRVPAHSKVSFPSDGMYEISFNDKLPDGTSPFDIYTIDIKFKCYAAENPPKATISEILLGNHQ